MTDRVLSMLLARQEWQAWASEAAAKRFTPAQRTDGDAHRVPARGQGPLRHLPGRGPGQHRRRSAPAARRHWRGRPRRAGRRPGQLPRAARGLGCTSPCAAAAACRRVVLAPIDDLHDTIGRLRDGDLTARTARTTSCRSSLRSATRWASWRPTWTRPRSRRPPGDPAGVPGQPVRDRGPRRPRDRRQPAHPLRRQHRDHRGGRAAGHPHHALAARREPGVPGRAPQHRPHGAPAPSALVPPPVVLSAAADAVPVTTGPRRAYPLVLAGMVTAVLEVETPVVDDDTEQVLTSLLSTAAAALESAHLHSTARELADLDGLTHLPNRRRFEHDIDTEWERCRRYGRPMSLVMMDLDHFKRLNDEHGHLLGDQVLREVADGRRRGAALHRHGLPVRRRGDRRAAARDRARGRRRGRRAARGRPSQVTIAGHPQVTVSTSAGVATRHTAMSHYTELVAKADKALYEAKRLGRNRVAVTGGGVGARRCSTASPTRHRSRRPDPDATTPSPAREPGADELVEPRGLEPLTPCLQSRCATNCAMAPGAAVRRRQERADVVGRLGPERLLALAGLGLPARDRRQRRRRGRRGRSSSSGFLSGCATARLYQPAGRRRARTRAGRRAGRRALRRRPPPDGKASL